VTGTTILLAAHDRLEYLKEAVASALAQRWPDFEVLVVDDGSGPETAGWLDLAARADLFAAHPDTDLVYCDHDQLLPDGKVEGSRYPEFASNAALLRATLLRPRVPFKHSGMTYARDVALALGSYDTRIGIKVDVDFFLRFVVAGKRIRHLPGGPAVSFRTHNESMSRKRGKGIRAWWTIIDRYGPKNPLLRLAFKAVRTTWELLKAVYTVLFWTER